MNMDQTQQATVVGYADQAGDQAAQLARAGRARHGAQQPDAPGSSWWRRSASCCDPVAFRPLAPLAYPARAALPARRPGLPGARPGRPAPVPPHAPGLEAELADVARHLGALRVRRPGDAARDREPAALRRRRRRTRPGAPSAARRGRGARGRRRGVQGGALQHHGAARAGRRRGGWAAT